MNTNEENFAPEVIPKLSWQQDNPMPRSLVMMVLDTSHSMWPLLGELNQSLELFEQAIKADTLASGNIEVAIISMGDRLVELRSFENVEVLPIAGLKIKPLGDTPIAAAIELGLEKMEERVTFYRDRGVLLLTPSFIILSDGRSSDDFTGSASCLKELSGQGRLNVYTVSLGENSDLEALRSFGDNTPIRVNRNEFRQAFRNIGQTISRDYEEIAPVVFAKGEECVEVKTSTVNELLLDGMNISFWRADCQSDIAITLSLARELQKRNIPFLVYFDATMRYQKNLEQDKFEQLLKDDPEHFVMIPAGIRADDFILQHADRTGSNVISNDCFRDFAKQYSWVGDRSRFYRGMVIKNRIMIPNLQIDSEFSLDDNLYNVCG
jgi:uncharacterized protein YegL